MVGGWIQLLVWDHGNVLLVFNWCFTTGMLHFEVRPFAVLFGVRMMHVVVPHAETSA